MLHSSIVAGADQLATRIKNRRADGYAAFCTSFAGFGQSDGKHGGVIEGQFGIHRASL